MKKLNAYRCVQIISTKMIDIINHSLLLPLNNHVDKRLCLPLHHKTLNYINDKVKESIKRDLYKVGQT